VDLANENVSIAWVCAQVGVSLPEWFDNVKSVKVHCPFGALSHSDFGFETAFRVYPETNSAYCFAGCGFYTPVWLYAQAKDLRAREAAEVLLDLVGYRSRTPDEEWERVSQVRERVSEIDLTEALRAYCSREPSWESRQFDPSVSATFARCLELLPRVRSVSDSRRWLEACKTVMARALRTEDA